MKITPLRLSFLYLLFAVVWIWLAVPVLSKLTGITMGPASGQMMGKVLFVLLSTSIFYVALSWYGNHRSEEHTSELQSRGHLVCRLLLEKKKRCRKTTHRERTQ